MEFNVNEVKAEKIALGIERRILLPAEKSTSKMFSVRHFVIEPAKEIEVKELSENLYYVISGHGSLTYDGMGALWTHYDFEGDSYAYLPPGQKHFITNNGECPLRVVDFSYSTPEATPTSIRVERWKKDYSRLGTRGTATDWCVGNESHVLLPREMLRPKGSVKLIFLEHEAFHPHCKLPLRGSIWALVYDALWYVISGRLRIIIDGEADEGSPGSLILAPKGTKMIMENSTDDVSVALLVGGVA